MAKEIAGQSSWDWVPKTTFFDGRHLACSLVTKNCSTDVDGENPPPLHLLFQNSCDGSWAPGLRLFSYRQAPVTGLLHPQHFGELCFLCGPSNGGCSTERRRIEQYLGTAESKLEQFSQRCRSLQREPVGASDLAGLWCRPLAWVVLQALRKTVCTPPDLLEYCLCSGDRILEAYTVLRTAENCSRTRRWLAPLDDDAGEKRSG
ncbi:hypothetical protein GGP78_003110 [Salinibacter ruber]|nr:hypothetical protein [Salinibacter ruber]